MRRLSIALRVLVAAMALTLVGERPAFSWAGSLSEEICDVDADFALGIEDYRAAIALHRKVLRAHKDSALAHYHLGFAYGMNGRTRDEIDEYLAAAKLGLERWDLFLNLGVAYSIQNDWQKSIDAFKTAVRLGPDHPEAHLNLAIAYERSHRSDEALREFNASQRLAPSDRDEVDTNASISAKPRDLVSVHDQ